MRIRYICFYGEEPAAIFATREEALNFYVHYMWQGLDSCDSVEDELTEIEQMYIMEEVSE